MATDDLVRIIPLNEKMNDYVVAVQSQLSEAGITAGCDIVPGKVMAKIMSAIEGGIRWILLIGGKEVDEGTVCLRDESIANPQRRDLGRMPVADAITLILTEGS